MSILINLKEDYLREIKKMEDQHKKNARTLSEEDANDEAILENIKLNIIDIFVKMFNISFDKASKFNGEDKVKLEKLYEGYLSFFDKIPANWYINMEKAKKFNKMEEYYKEEIKIEMAENMKKIFIEYYNTALVR